VEVTDVRGRFLTIGHPRVILGAVAVGILSGSAAIVFRFLATRLPRLIWPADPNLVHAVAQAPLWWRIVVPVAGSFLAGAVLTFGTRWLGPVRGWDILEAVLLRDGVLHLRPALVKSLSSLLTTASAGPIGREGPMVLLAAAVASFAGRYLGFPTRHLRILVACGVAAGIACAYNTPIGAAFFTMEIIVGNFALEVFAPLVFASVVATLLSSAVFGATPVFQVSEFALASRWEILNYMLLGVLGGVTAAVFLEALRASFLLFRRSRLPRPVAMSLAGLIVGIVILGFPQVVGNGREGIRDLFQEEWGPRLALTLLALRLVATSVTVGSGAVGGVFTPTLFLGAVLGDAFGSIVHRLFPLATAVPKAYALAGMGCLLAGTTHAPITAVLMIFEMTLNYSITLPLLVATVAASLVAKGLSLESVYTEALSRKRSAWAEGGEAAVMRTLTVRDVMRSEQMTVPADTPLPQLLDRFIATRRNHLYVVGPDGRFEGVVSLHDANRALREVEDPSQFRATDFANSNFQTTVPWEHLDHVLDRFWVQEAEHLPVLGGRDSHKLIGTISRRDILGVYSLEVLHRRSLLARFETEEGPQSGPTYVELPPDHQIDNVPVPATLVGRTIGESRFREHYGVSVLLIRRTDGGGREIRMIPDSSTKFQVGDRLVVFGSREKVDALKQQ